MHLFAAVALASVHDRVGHRLPQRQSYLELGLRKIRLGVGENQRPVDGWSDVLHRPWEGRRKMRREPAGAITIECEYLVCLNFHGAAPEFQVRYAKRDYVAVQINRCKFRASKSRVRR